MLVVVREMTRADIELVVTGFADVNKRQDGLEGKRLCIGAEQQRIKYCIEQMEDDGNRLPQIAPPPPPSSTPPAHAPRNQPTPLDELMGGLVAVYSYATADMHAFCVIFGYFSAVMAVLLTIGFIRMARAKAKRLKMNTAD